MIKRLKNLACWQFGIPIKPKEIVFEVTDACNSRCLHCNIWKKKPTPFENILKPDELRSLLKDKIFSDLEAILITGGEPMLRRDILELMVAMHKCAPQASQWLSTNGLSPDYTVKVVKNALNRGIKLGVGVSLDGVGQNHDKIRGINGNFEKVCALLRTLKEMNVHITLGFVLSPFTASFYQDVQEFAKSQRIPLLVQAYEEAPYYTHKEHKIIVDENTHEIVKQLPRDFRVNLWLKFLEGRNHKFKCFALNSFFVLHCNGEIAPCLKFAGCSVGNIRNADFSTIWKGRLANRMRKCIRNCDGCLNTWATELSFQSLYYPILFHKLMGLRRHILRKLLGRYSFTSILNSQLTEERTILDVGCGRSSPLKSIKSKPYRVGLDNFKPYISISKRDSIHSDYCLADARHLPFKFKSFDCVIAIEVIEHLCKSDGFKMIKEMERVGKNKIIISTPNGFWEVIRSPDALNPEEKHISGWVLDEFKNLDFEVFGFNGLRVLWKAIPGGVVIKFRPQKLFWFIAKISEPVVHFYPSLAFQLLCIKNWRK